jgi:hypothetical protein
MTIRDTSLQQSLYLYGATAQLLGRLPLPEPSATPREQRGRRVFTAGAILLVILGLVHPLSLIKAPAPGKLGWRIVGLRS